jgi:hypothetical protein
MVGPSVKTKGLDRRGGVAAERLSQRYRLGRQWADAASAGERILKARLGIL